MLITSDFDQDARWESITGKQIEKNSAEIDTMVRGLGNLKAEEFDATDDVFQNPLSQKKGTSKVEFRYALHHRVVLVVFIYIAT